MGLYTQNSFTISQTPLSEAGRFVTSYGSGLNVNGTGEVIAPSGWHSTHLSTGEGTWTRNCYVEAAVTSGTGHIGIGFLNTSGDGTQAAGIRFHSSGLTRYYSDADPADLEIYATLPEPTWTGTAQRIGVELVDEGVTDTLTYKLYVDTGSGMQLTETNSTGTITMQDAVTSLQPWMGGNGSTAGITQIIARDYYELPTADLDVDFSGIADANPWTDSDWTVHNGTFRIESGMLKGNNIASFASYTGGSISDANNLSASILTSGTHSSGDPIGPALLDENGNGYLLYCQYNETRLHRVVAGVRDALIGAGNADNDINGNEVATIHINESTGVITTYDRGVQIEQVTDTTYTNLRPAVYYSFQNNRGAGISRFQANGWSSSGPAATEATDTVDYVPDTGRTVITVSGLSGSLTSKDWGFHFNNLANGDQVEFATADSSFVTHNVDGTSTVTSDGTTTLYGIDATDGVVSEVIIAYQGGTVHVATGTLNVSLTTDATKTIYNKYA